MKLNAIASLLTILCFAGGTASGQSIGVFFDQQASDCDATVAPNSPVTWYILALLGGPTASGLTGVEFRQEGTPSTWFMTATGTPCACVTVGNPIREGTNLAFPSCQTGSGGVVLLYTVSGFATNPVMNHWLSITRHTTPSNPNYPCPLQVLCDAPLFSVVCVAGGQAVINGECAMAVEPRSWSKVKALYE